MTSAFFGVSDTPWCLCQPIISFWPAPWCFKLTTSFVNCPEPVVGARVCTQMTIIENSQSTIHLLQKGTSWAYWDPLRPSLDGFHRIVGFFVIHQLFLWPLIPLVSFCQLFKSPLVVQCCNVICEWPLMLSYYRFLKHLKPKGSSAAEKAGSPLLLVLWWSDCDDRMIKCCTSSACSLHHLEGWCRKIPTSH